MKVEQFSLKNGLNVFLVPQKEATSVAVQLLVAAGSKNEKKGNYGLAHFLEHMAFKGTKKWPTAKILAKILDSSGAVYNASTGKEGTDYWIRVTPKKLDLALEIISQMLIHALLPSPELEVERGVIIEEMNMYQDQPRDLVGDYFEEQLFGKNALGRAIIGKKKDILRVKAQDFLDFKKQWYLGSNMSLAVVGAIPDLKKVRQNIKKLYDVIEKGEVERLEIGAESKKEEIFWQKKKAEQTHFVLGFPGVTVTDERKWALEILMAILGQGMSSRLWEEVREKRGLAYYVYSFYGNMETTGCFGAAAGVKNQSSKLAIELVKDEFVKLTKNLTKEEVTRAKTMSNGQFLISVESPLKVAMLLNGHWLNVGKVMTPEDLIKRSNKVTFDEVRKVAKELIDLSDLRGAVIGPR
ncbi:MAG: pitrilysin family protein [Candidatus Shapirobacteria bacterium]